jgi:hypothetical protein
VSGTYPECLCSQLGGDPIEVWRALALAPNCRGLPRVLHNLLGVTQIMTTGEIGLAMHPEQCPSVALAAILPFFDRDKWQLGKRCNLDMGLKNY